MIENTDLLLLFIVVILSSGLCYLFSSDMLMSSSRYLIIFKLRRLLEVSQSVTNDTLRSSPSYYFRLTDIATVYRDVHLDDDLMITLLTTKELISKYDTLENLIDNYISFLTIASSERNLEQLDYATLAEIEERAIVLCENYDIKNRLKHILLVDPERLIGDSNGYTRESFTAPKDI
jgi:hypothetical protein